MVKGRKGKKREKTAKVYKNKDSMWKNKWTK